MVQRSMLSVAGRGFVALIDLHGQRCQGWPAQRVHLSVPGRGFVALIGDATRITTLGDDALRALSVPGRGFVALIAWRASEGRYGGLMDNFQSPGGDSWL